MDLFSTSFPKIFPLISLSCFHSRPTVEFTLGIHLSFFETVLSHFSDCFISFFTTVLFRFFATVLPVFFETVLPVFFVFFSRPYCPFFETVLSLFLQPDCLGFRDCSASFFGCTAFFFVWC